MNANELLMMSRADEEKAGSRWILILVPSSSRHLFSAEIFSPVCLDVATFSTNHPSRIRVQYNRDYSAESLLVLT